MTLAALILATKLVYTGLVLFVPSKSDPHLIRVIAPNGRVPNDFETEAHITPHLTYVMFAMKDLVKCDNCRKPNFTLLLTDGRKFGVIIVESESLTLDGNFSRAKKLEYKPPPSDIHNPTPDDSNKESLHWMFDCCHDIDEKPVLIDTKLLVEQPDRDRVGLRMDLRYGRFAVDSIAQNVSFTVRQLSEKTFQCQSLTSGVAVTIPNRKNSDVTRLTIRSRLFRGSALRPLRLARNRADGDLKVLIGNETSDDLKASVKLLAGAGAELGGQTSASGHNDGATVIQHMLLMNRILSVPEGVNLFTPTRFKAELCDRSGTVQIEGAPSGMSGGCSPPIHPPADPKP